MKRRRKKTGFTLVEVLLVLAILVILGAMVGVGVVQVQKQANAKAARSQIGMLENAINLYRVNVGIFPSQLQDLRDPPNDLRNPDKWQQVLDKEIPYDPWGNEYNYVPEGDTFRIWSNGPDGAEGGNDDITNQ